MSKKPAAKPALQPKPQLEAREGEPEIVDGIQKGQGAVEMFNGSEVHGFVTFNIHDQYFQVERKSGMVDDFPAILVKGVRWAKR